jgi:phosphatidylserine/phosphatidylglycerophosphate/cardiolipin synthase-like enzyme
VAVKLGSLEFYTDPTVLGGPDDLDAVIRGFIDGAKHSLYVAVQELDSEPIARAILAARARKVRIQLILEGDYLREVDTPVVDPWTAGGTNEGNRTIYAALRLLPAVRIRGVLDRGQGGQAWAATSPLKAAGAQLFVNRPGTGVRKVHHKLMVIDGRLIIIGSFNHTAPANTINDENIIVLGDLEETNPVAEAAQRQLADYALAEIDRTITSLAQPA